MAQAAKSLKVFVSDSRAHVDFADQLVLALEDMRFAAILDRHDILGAEEWRTGWAVQKTFKPDQNPTEITAPLR